MLSFTTTTMFKCIFTITETIRQSAKTVPNGIFGILRSIETAVALLVLAIDCSHARFTVY